MSKTRYLYLGHVHFDLTCPGSQQPISTHIDTQTPLQHRYALLFNFFVDIFFFTCKRNQYTSCLNAHVLFVSPCCLNYSVRSSVGSGASGRAVVANSAAVADSIEEATVAGVTGVTAG